jgi:hypothetical protein
MFSYHIPERPLRQPGTLRTEGWPGPLQDQDEYGVPLMAGGIPGQPGPDTPAEPGSPDLPTEPGEPLLPDQPPPAPVA